MEPSWERIRPLIDELLELDAAEVSRVIDARCGDDDALRQRLRALLAVDADSRWLDPPPRSAGAFDRTAAEERIGPYRLVRELGRGGQATVHLAEDERIPGRRVAVKVLHGSSLLRSDAMARFRREAAVASRLEHPGICPVHEAGVDGGRPYIAMRYVEGETLARHLGSSRNAGATEATSFTVDLAGAESPEGPEPRTAGSIASGPATRDRVMGVVRLIERTARALHAAHEAGIIHRDVKPGNVMVTGDGQPVLLDFGLARELDGLTMTREGEVFGTPAYMSPEQLLAHRVRLDARTDVWSLGVMLYEALTLQRPFQAPTREGLFQAIQTREPVDPRELNPAIPRDLAIVIETALAKDRDRRYQSALDLAEDLRRVREREPIAARPASPWIKLQRWTQRNPALAGSLGAGLLAITGGLIVSLVLLAQRDGALAEKAGALERYEQMSDMALVEELRSGVDALWPRRNRVAPAMRDWLRRAREVRARRAAHAEARDALRALAAPDDADRRAADDAERRRRHPEVFDAVATCRRRIHVTRQKLEALQQQVTAVEHAIDGEDDERLLLRHEKRRDRLAVAQEESRASLASLQEQLREREADPRLTERLTWRLPSLPQQWRHDVLTRLVRELDGLEREIRDVTARLAFAETIEDRSVSAHASAWSRCREDLARNPAYAACEGLASALPCVGLVPLGIDRRSGLWEFWHVESGRRPGWRGTSWPDAPDADPGGEADIDESTGIVLVLVPGGRFVMGSSREPGTERFDPDAHDNETPLHEVTLDPFFIGKHELTQGQWQRLTGERPSTYGPGAPTLLGGMVTASHPVTNVSWNASVAALRRWDLVLPTEARWEYACRAGTTERFWCGDEVESLQEARAGNVADRTARPHVPWRCSPLVEDGRAIHAPVGTFSPNPFGLHDVLGNVWEWCADVRASYDDPPAPGDGLREAPGIRFRVMRGGGFNAPPAVCRSAYRGINEPTGRDDGIGLRVARDLR